MPLQHSTEAIHSSFAVCSYNKVFEMIKRPQKRFFFLPSVSDRVVQACTKVVGLFGAEVVRVQGEATHVIVPDIEAEDDGQDYCRTLDVQEPPQLLPLFCSSLVRWMTAVFSGDTRQDAIACALVVLPRQL